MNGLTRTFWALAAVSLRAVAWLPVIAGDWLLAAANACDQRARPSPVLRPGDRP